MMTSKLTLIMTVITIIAIASGCNDSSYFTSDLKSTDLVGTWGLAKDEGGIPGQASSEIRFSSDGRFTARNTPIRVSPGEFTFVSDEGRWSIIEDTSDRMRYRWKLDLIFEGTRKGVKWDVLSGDDGITLMYRTSVDTLKGYQFVKSE